MPARVSPLVLWCLALVLASAERAGAIEGTVVGPSGPMAGVRVTALRVPAPWRLDAGTIDEERALVREVQASAVELARARTSKDGRFSLASVPKGARVAVWADAAEAGQAVVELGSAPMRITLGPAFLLDGDSLVRGSPDYPYPEIRKGIRIVAVHTRFPVVVHGQTDERGAFRLGYVPEGDYQIIAAARGLAPQVTWLHLPPLPLSPPPRPPPTPPTIPASEFQEDVAAPARRLGRPDKDYHEVGALFFVFLDTSSVSGTVTERGRPVKQALVRLAGPEGIVTRRTDAAGRFSFDDLMRNGTTYGLEVTSGQRQLRQCALLVSAMGGSWCSASQPETVVPVEEGVAACRFRIAWDEEMKAPPDPSKPGLCQESVLEAFNPDGGQPAR